jgi:hypothetical protein
MLVLGFAVKLLLLLSSLSSSPPPPSCKVYSYIPETNHVSRVYSVEAVLYS